MTLSFSWRSIGRFPLMGGGLALLFAGLLVLKHSRFLDVNANPRLVLQAWL